MARRYTKEEIEILRHDLTKGGMTASQVGVKLGRSKNSIISRARRSKIDWTPPKSDIRRRMYIGYALSAQGLI